MSPQASLVASGSAIRNVAMHISPRPAVPPAKCLKRGCVASRFGSRPPQFLVHSRATNDTFRIRYVLNIITVGMRCSRHGVARKALVRRDSFVSGEILLLLGMIYGIYVLNYLRLQ